MPRAKRVRASALVGNMDKAAKRLLERAFTTTVEPVTGDEGGDGQPPVEPTVAEQIAAFTAVKGWVQTKAKIDPDAESGDFISTHIASLGDGPVRRRGTAATGRPPKNGYNPKPGQLPRADDVELFDPEAEPE